MVSTRRTFVAALASAAAGWRAVRVAAQTGLPEGVPAGSAKAVVTGYEDGDKYRVDIGEVGATVLMISADAPERGRCFFNASSTHLKDLLPVGTTVYLEQDGESEDKKGRLLRYTWKPREGKTAQLIDERMIADGYSRFKARDGHSKRDKRLAKAEVTAKTEKRGLWSEGACNPSARKKTPTPAPTAKPTDAAVEVDSGSSGYSGGLGQSRNDFEALHGAPNPKYSIPGLEHYGEIDYSFLVSYINGNVWNLTYQLPDIPFSTAEDLALALIPDDSMFISEYYPQTYSTVRVYNSQSLIPRLEYADFDVWMGETPGTFIVIYDYDEASRAVFSITIAPGNNP